MRLGMVGWAAYLIGCVGFSGTPNKNQSPANLKPAVVTGIDPVSKLTRVASEDFGSRRKRVWPVTRPIGFGHLNLNNVSAQLRARTFGRILNWLGWHFLP